jgi:hypothetical protein
MVLARSRDTSVKRKRLLAGKTFSALSARQLESLRVRILRFNEAVAKQQPTNRELP